MNGLVFGQKLLAQWFSNSIIQQSHLESLLISILEVFDSIGLGLGPKFTFYLKLPGDAASLGPTLKNLCFRGSLLSSFEYNKKSGSAWFLV